MGNKKYYLGAVYNAWINHYGISDHFKSGVNLQKKGLKKLVESKKSGRSMVHRKL